MVLEVCVENVRSAVSAWRGGARRLELCSSLCLGGLTPSLGLFTAVKRSVPPECVIFVMIRPRQSESYVYDEDEVEVMVEDILIFKEKGANGFVFGCLDEKKEIDQVNCKKLLEAADGLPCTFHRAFDFVRNPFDSLAVLSELGFSRILTSGQEKNAFLGRFMIQKLISKAKESGSTVIIVAGGGICPGNLKEILKTTGVKEYHGSARAEMNLSAEESHGVYVTDQLVVLNMIKIGQSFYQEECETYLKNFESKKEPETLQCQ